MAPDFTRREFLKTMSVLTAAGALGPLVAHEAAAAAPHPTPVVRGQTALTLTINGQIHQLQVEPRVTLLSALRHYLNPPLTGTKEVCNRGSCGACTVHLDGRPVLACMLLAIDAVGHQITTIEGLGHEGQLDPVQQAFVECDGLMCGFCTPGFVMSARALLDHHKNPSDAEIQRACAGNFCRCGAYPKIFEAVRKASHA